MKSLSFLILLLSFLFTSNIFALSHRESPLQISELLERFNASPAVKNNVLSNGAIAIVHQNKIIYQKVFGFKNNHSEKLTTDTLFPLASCSKPITAALTAYLVKQKALTFDDNIHDTLPNFPSQIQLKHLLSHSSGYVDLIGDKAIEKGKRRENLIHLFSHRRRDYPTGEKYSYSNVLFSLIADVIEKTTQLSFKANAKAFLEKLGINEAEICDVSHPESIAIPHRKTKNKLLPIGLPKFYPKAACAAAGFYLSLDQMTKFSNFMLGHYPQVLGKSDLEVFFQPRVEAGEIFTLWKNKWPFPKNEMKSSYSLGWRILEYNRKQNPFIFHGGTLNGVSTLIGLLPQHDLGIIILSNQDVFMSSDIGLDFWKLSMDL